MPPAASNGAISALPTPHTVPCTLNPANFRTLHSELRTLYPVPCTANSQLRTPNLIPCPYLQPIRVDQHTAMPVLLQPPIGEMF